MVKRVGVLLMLAACSGRTPPASDRERVVLRGFRLVDVSARTIRDKDVTLENGVVVADAGPAASKVVEGHGAYLLPALWDLKASLWGNNSTQDYQVLTQEVSFTRCLQLHLHYGVGHVAVFGMDRAWVERELKRVDAFELAAAEPLYPDKVLCQKPSFACEPVVDAASAHRAVSERHQRGAPFVYVSLHDSRDQNLTGVSDAVLAEVAAAARARRLPLIALVQDAEQARRAVDVGVRVIYGLPASPLPDSLLTVMAERGVALAPPLTRFLELDRLLGNEAELKKPFLSATVRPDVLDSYRDDRRLWAEWRPDLLIGRARRQELLTSVARAAALGVPIVATSDAGWTAGTFQGYASHGAQLWLERAGLDGWARLAAATTAPAAVFGKSIGFEPGHPADFVAVEANPVESAANLRRISLVLRRGKVVNREELLPDLTRGNYVR